MSRSVLVTGGNRGIGRAIAEAFVASATRSRHLPQRRAARGRPRRQVRRHRRRRRGGGVHRGRGRARPGGGAGRQRRRSPRHPAAADERGGLVLGHRDQPHRLLPGRQARGEGDAAAARGRIIFISSVVGLLGSAGQVNYAASKAGLVGMARSLARELGSRSITANVVAPGFVETEMTAVLPEETQGAVQGADPARPLCHHRGGRRRRPAGSPPTPPATSPAP